MPCEDTAWITWLERDQTRALLATMAERIYRSAERLALPSELLPCSGWSRLGAALRADCRQMLADDLWIFFREQGPKLVRSPAWKHWDEQGPEALKLRLTGLFIRHLKDQARTRDQDPGRAFYRRLRQVLAAEPTIHYRADHLGAHYSLDAEAPPLGDPARLTEEPYRSWPSTLGELSAAELGRRAGVVLAARRFWELARDRLGGPVFVPVRELAKYLQAHYNDLNLQRTESLDDPDRSGGAAEEAAGLAETPLDPAVQVTRGRLPELARRLAARFNDRQAAAFYWVQGAGLTLREAADRLGYRNAAGARYPYQRALTVIRDFCLEWPGLAQPELDRDLFDAFIEAVLEICKNRSERRISELSR